MDRRQAAAHLGVAVDASPIEVRSAFRRLLRRHHPDVTGGDGADARHLTEAYRVLRRPVARVTATTTTSSSSSSSSDDTLALALAPDEAFDALVDAGAAIGDVTYVDAEAGLLEVLITFDDGRRASALITLQGRATGTTDAFVTLEGLGNDQAPAPAVVLRALVEALG